MNLLLVDNYDSFAYNVFHLLRSLDVNVHVARNDMISCQEIYDMKIDAAVISPGPCTPHESGVCVPMIQRFARDLPIMGVCLGHQAIATAFGGDVVVHEPVHGRVMPINHNGKRLFKTLKTPFLATRYHSLVVSRETLPACFDVDAEDGESKIIMAISHREFPCYGVQFHPESFLSEHGRDVCENFLSLVSDFHSRLRTSAKQKTD